MGALNHSTIAEQADCNQHQLRRDLCCPETVSDHLHKLGPSVPAALADAATEGTNGLPAKPDSTHDQI